MFDFAIVALTVSCLALIDINLHIMLDIKKIKMQPRVALQGSQIAIPSLAVATAGIATLLSFLLVFLLILLWLGLLNQTAIQLLIPLIDPPPLIWGFGLVILSSGIVLHGWSRATRQNMASSWEMSNSHRLVTSGPYAWIRHPSYLSYIMCFIGFILLIPSVVTLVLLLGIPGYYYVARTEEIQLKQHFGEEYVLYIQRTGMFLPTLRRSKS